MHITFFCPIDLGNDVANNNQQLLSGLLTTGKNHIVNQAMPELICQQFGVEANPDHPIAALSGEFDNSISTKYYLQADPVHLVLQRDAFALSDLSTLAITKAELLALSELLNQHFMADGLFFKVNNERLLLGLIAVPRISTTLPEKVIGRNIYDYLPQGADASYWNKIVNEMQMLLHEHPFNQRREALGFPIINSIWLSGGGFLPATTMSPFNRVFSDVSYVQRLAQLAGVSIQKLPSDRHIELNQDQVLVVTQSNTDIYVWIDILYELINKGATLQLNLAHQDVVLVSEIRPGSVYKLWLYKLLRKKKPVISHFHDCYTKMQNKINARTKF